MVVALTAEVAEVVVVLVAETAAKGYEVAARGRPGVPPHLAVCHGAGRYSQGGRSRACRRRRRR
eukprot:4605385-Prymnesium_polylepis.1